MPAPDPKRSIEGQASPSGYTSGCAPNVATISCSENNELHGNPFVQPGMHKRMILFVYPIVRPHDYVRLVLKR